MYLNQNFFDFQSLTGLKEIKIQNSKILTMNPETFKALSNFNFGTASTSSIGKSSYQQPPKQQQQTSSRASFQDLTLYHNNSPDLNKNKVYQGLKDLKKLALDINEMITINNDNQINEKTADSKENVSKCLEKINANEKKFEQELLKIETKLANMSSNFEKRFDITLEKMQANELKMYQFKAEVNDQLTKIEVRLDHNIDNKLNEININFEKQFEEFAGKLNQTFQDFFLNLKKESN